MRGALHHVPELVEAEQRVVTGAAEVPVVCRALLLAVGFADRAIHVQDEFLHWPAFPKTANPFPRQVRKDRELRKIREVLDRHRGESGIVYAIRRTDVDDLAGELARRGYPALPYHAGMTGEDRRRNQDLFLREDAAVMVATVAFGMGIDKPNVRFVLHAGMPKTLEHYLQESGRAGRDGLEAECVLLHSGADFLTWNALLKDVDPEARAVALEKLGEMAGYCRGTTCRHQSLVRYFGQELEAADCGACDVCLGELEVVENPREPSQKILSCVLRLKERFGADYTAQVLTGSKEQRLLANGHQTLSTYGLLAHGAGHLPCPERRGSVPGGAGFRIRKRTGRGGKPGLGLADNHQM